MNGDFPKSGARATMRTKLSSGRGSECLGLAMEHALYEIKRDIIMCTDFEMLKVKSLSNSSVE